MPLALGFHPPVTFPQGLKRTADWLAFAEGDFSVKLPLANPTGVMPG
jgi:hypothetical protein